MKISVGRNLWVASLLVSVTIGVFAQDSTPSSSSNADENTSSALSNEDEIFWERFLSWGGGNRDWNWNKNDYTTTDHHHHNTYYNPIVSKPRRQYSFSIPPPQPPCRVNVDLDCRTSSGTPCNQIQPRNNQCSEEIVWDIDIQNIGPVPMTVDMVDVVYQGQMISLLGNIAGQNPVGVGNRVRTQQRFTIDVCQPNQYNGRVSVSASPEGGSPCFADDSYNL